MDPSDRHEVERHLHNAAAVIRRALLARRPMPNASAREQERDMAERAQMSALVDRIDALKQDVADRRYG